MGHWDSKPIRRFIAATKGGEIKVNIFKLPGRRGWFALTNDLAAWLFSQAEGGRNDGLNQEKGRS